MKFKVFKIRLEKKSFKIDQKKVNRFKEKVNVKKHDISTIIENEKPILIVVYHYVDKAEVQYDLTKEQKNQFEVFKEWRKYKYEEEDIKPYMVLSDKVICSIIKKKPTNLKELQAINGIGVKKVEKYGEEIVSIINSY